MGFDIGRTPEASCPDAFRGQEDDLAELVTVQTLPKKHAEFLGFISAFVVDNQARTSMVLGHCVDNQLLKRNKYPCFVLDSVFYSSLQSVLSTFSLSECSLSTVKMTEVCCGGIGIFQIFLVYWL